MASGIVEARDLVVEWSKSQYVEERGMTLLEVNHWLKEAGIDLPWSAILSLLEGLVKNDTLTRTTSVGSRRISYPPHVYWPNEKAGKIHLAYSKKKGA